MKPLFKSIFVSKQFSLLNGLGLMVWLLPVAVLVSGWGEVLYAQEGSAQTGVQGETSWEQGFTLIMMGNTDIASANQAHDYVMSQGGRIAILSPPHVMVGWVDPELAQKLLGNYGIEEFSYNPIELAQLKYHDDQALALVSFYNAVASGSLRAEMTVAASRATLAEPLANDVLEHPEVNKAAYEQNLRKFGISPLLGNSDSMTGSVAVCLFFVESDGSIDSSRYTWSQTDQQNTYNRAMSGLAWWSNKAATYQASVSFAIHYYGATDSASRQGYEPILHPHTDDHLWIERIMANLGFDKGNKVDRVTAFNTWLKEEKGTDWAYSVFIGYNPSPAPTTFTDGWSAYAHKGGPFSQVLFVNNGYGQEGFGRVLTHETAHIFWACDEYKDGCNSCGPCASSGPRPEVLNGNCEECNSESVACIMRHTEDALCFFTPLQIGWLEEHPCDWGNEVANSPLPLHLPFAPNTTWKVGGTSYYYGDGAHNDSNNDYYATDWNMVDGNDFGQPVYSVAPGKVVEVRTACDCANNKCIGDGNYVDVVHSFQSNPGYGTLKTRYAHLCQVSVNVGEIVYVDTQLGTVGGTGNLDGSPRLHLSFQIYNGSKYVSLHNTTPSRRPGPMIARNGAKNELWELCDGQARTVANKHFFSDVLNDWYKKWVDAVYAWGVMKGCAPNKFCWDVPVTRADVAEYWVKAYHGPDFTPPPATGSIFDDVPVTHAKAAWIEQLYKDGFIVGCSINPPLYCPDRNVKRAEMAVIILRALHGISYFPPPPTGTRFDDCPLEYWGTKWVEQLEKEGITSGCSSDPPLFCPENPVVRAEMAVFLLRSFGIYPQVIGGSGASGVEELSTWQGNLTVSDAGSGTATLIFGQAPSATDGLDSAFAEAELPPAPPSGIFDARFELPVSPPINSLKDYRPDAEEETTTWKLKFQAGSGGFPVTLSWNSAELPAGDFLLKDAITGTIVNVNMKNQNTYSVTNNAITSLVVEKTNVFTVAVNANTGWNIISVPVKAADMSAKTLFPDATSDAYRFESGYVPTPVLSNGSGYWLKFNSSRAIQITGFKVTPREIAVKAGWNIIGPLESDVPISAITSQPSGIVKSDYFGFDNGYTTATTLQVGRGYWVKVSQDGKLLFLSASATFSKSVEAIMVEDATPEEISSWPRIRFEDGKGQARTLYLAPYDKMDKAFELPPLPPVGIFDVRYGTERYVESLNGTSLEVLVNSAQYPLKIKAENLEAMSLIVQDAMGGKVLDETLTVGKEITVAQVLGMLLLKKGESVVLPTHYALSQNYPNPFNPTTVIKYALPKAGHVKISVYNILGEKVTDLVDTELAAGYHQVEVNARQYASGVYFYVMKAGEFKAVKKLVIMR